MLSASDFWHQSETDIAIGRVSSTAAEQKMTLINPQ